MDSETLSKSIKSVYFGWIPRSLDPWIRGQLEKDFCLFILAGSLFPLSLRFLDSEMIRERLTSVYYGWIPIFLDPWIQRHRKDLSLFISAGSLDPWILGF